MKYLALALLVILGCAPTPLTSTTLARNERASPTVAGAQRRLQLTTTIIREFSCSSNDLALSHFALGLHLTLKNDGETPVIIDKRSFWLRSLVSSSIKAAAAKKYVHWARGDMWGDLPIQPSGLSDFVILKPGEVYDFEEETRATFMVSHDPANPFHRFPPGSYFLQIEVATWRYMEDVRKFRELWRDQGYLWSGVITSQPMPFTIEQNRPITKCQ